MGLWTDRSFPVLPGVRVCFDRIGRVSWNIGPRGFFVNLGGGNGVTLSRGNPADGVPYPDLYGYRADGAPYNRPRTRRPTSVGGWLFILLLGGVAWWSYRHHTTPDVLLRQVVGQLQGTSAEHRTGATSVHLRAQPSTHATVLATLPPRTTVKVLSGAGVEWTHVRTPQGQEGYVASRLLEQAKQR